MTSKQNPRIVKKPRVKKKKLTEFVASPPTLYAIPTSTQEEAKTTEGQRLTSAMWETTQMRIAIWVVVGGFVLNSFVIFSIVLIRIIVVAYLLPLMAPEDIMPLITITVVESALIMACLQSINTIGGIVIGFYFSRTNHTKVGGAGPKAEGVVR